MYLFRDKNGRNIEIEVSDCCAEAYYAGERVGDVQTTGVQEIDLSQDPFPAQITGWNVDPDFRNAGIATELVRLLSEAIGKLIAGKKDEGRGGQNTLTDEGMGLTIHCQNLGYVFPFPNED